MIYKIYTEDKNPKRITEFIDEVGIDGYTVYSTYGVWKGKAEKSIVIEFVGNVELKEKVMKIARFVKEHNEQEYVMVTEEIGKVFVV